MIFIVYNHGTWNSLGLETTNENVNSSVESPAPRYVTCYCLHCKGGIEFDANFLRPNEKRAITCPHCKAETILFLAEPKAPPAVPAAEVPAPKVEPAPLPPPITPPPPKPEPAKPVLPPPPPKLAPIESVAAPAPLKPEPLPVKAEMLPAKPVESPRPAAKFLQRLKKFSFKPATLPPKRETLPMKPEVVVPKPEPAPLSPKLEAIKPALESLPPKLAAIPVAPEPTLTKPETAPVPPAPAKPVEWQVEIPLGGRDGYIGYYEGERAASFYWEFGGGVVQAIIHIGSSSHWSKLYPWAAERRMEILQRLIQEVIRQRGLVCKADIDEKSGHIFFRDREVAKPTPAPIAKPIELPKEPAKESRNPATSDEAKWQQQMGVAYFRQKDFGAAVKCFLQAAELGDVEAQCYLGFCFMYGQGVEKDEAKSLSWFLKAAAQGNVGAEYCLGGAYYLGRGVAKDFSAAVKWWRKAGEHGNADAQFSLAGCFEKGEGVMQNYVEAYKWARRAAAQGHQAAPKKAEALLLKMNPEQSKIVKALG